MYVSKCMCMFGPWSHVNSELRRREWNVFRLWPTYIRKKFCYRNTTYIHKKMFRWAMEYDDMTGDNEWQSVDRLVRCIFRRRSTTTDNWLNVEMLGLVRFCSSLFFVLLWLNFFWHTFESKRVCGGRGGLQDCTYVCMKYFETHHLFASGS